MATNIYVDLPASSTSPTITAVSSNITLANNTIYLVDTTAPRTLALPSPSSGLTFQIKDSTGNANANNITVTRFASEKIEGVAASFVINSSWAEYAFLSNGTDWFLV